LVPVYEFPSLDSVSVSVSLKYPAINPVVESKIQPKGCGNKSIACRYPRTHTEVSAYGGVSDVFPLSAIAVPLNESLANSAVIHKPGSHDALMAFSDGMVCHRKTSHFPY
jgi:hypothetical protein